MTKSYPKITVFCEKTMKEENLRKCYECPFYKGVKVSDNRIEYVICEYYEKVGHKRKKNARKS